MFNKNQDKTNTYKNLFYISSFIAFTTFLIVVVSFWTCETFFWNYSPFKIAGGSGGQFVNSTPLYGSRSLASLHNELQLILSSIELGSLFFIISIISILFCSYVLKTLTVKLLAILGFGTSLLAGIGFWLYVSLNLNVRSGDYYYSGSSEVNFTPTSWLHDLLHSTYSSFSFLGFLIAIVFSILTLVLILSMLILAFLDRRKKQKAAVYTGKIKVPITQYITFYAVMFVYLIITLIPVILTFLVSFLNTSDLTAFRDSNNLFPAPSNFLSSTIINYSTVLFVVDSFTGQAFTRSLLISLFLGFGTSIIGLGMSLTSAYALSRFKFIGRGKLIFSLVVLQMFPGIILLIPQYVMWTSLGLLNKNERLWGVLLALSVGAISYSTWMMKGYFDTLPRDLEEASLIDGANVFETFIRIALPLAKPGMVAVFLFTFLGAWNDFILVRTFIGENQGDSTLSLLFYKYQNSSAPDVPVVFQLVGAYSIIMALPICIVFIILQKYLAAGATAGAIK